MTINSIYFKNFIITASLVLVSFLLLATAFLFLGRSILGSDRRETMVETAQELAEHVKNALGCGAVKFTRGSKMIKHVAVVGGAGGEYAPAICAAEADALVTGEAKHNELIDAVNADITLIVAGHHETEVVVLPKLAELLRREFPETEFIVSAEPSPAAIV